MAKQIEAVEKQRPRSSITAQRDEAILLALRLAAETEPSLVLAAMEVMRLQESLEGEATPAERHWIGVIKAAMGAPSTESDS